MCFWDVAFLSYYHLMTAVYRIIVVGVSKCMLCVADFCLIIISSVSKIYGFGGIATRFRKFHQHSDSFYVTGFRS